MAEAESAPPRHGSKLAALELLRGLAALQVAFVHMLGFWGAFHTVMVGAGLAWVPTIISGRVAVGVFFLMSGYVLQRSSFVTGHGAYAVVSRYVRLALPVAASAVFVHLLMALGWFDFEKVRVSLESPQHLWVEIPGFGSSLKDALITHFSSLVTPEDEYRMINPPTWTISFEFFGSILILMFSRLRTRLVRRVLSTALVITLGAVGYPYSELLFFPLAVLFVDLAEEPLRRALAEPRARWMLRTVLVAALLAGALVEQFAVVTVALFALFITAGTGWPTGRLRSLAIETGRLSFSIYLVHFPLYIAIMTAATPALSRQWLLDLARSAATRLPAAVTLVAVILGVFATYSGLLVLCAWAFERFVDRPSIVLASAVRKAQGRVGSPGAQPLSGPVPTNGAPPQ